MHWNYWFDIVDSDVSDHERSVNASSFSLESSGYQCQDGINRLQQHFSFLEVIQILLHIFQGVKATQMEVCSF
jgi:hypothetical protein